MDQNTPESGKVLFVGRDIFLGTMIAQAVQRAGFRYRSVTSGELRNAVDSDPSVRALVVDLKESVDALSDIAEASRMGQQPLLLIGIAFHTDSESKHQAQKAGIDHVIHRSRIGPDLPHILMEKKI